MSAVLGNAWPEMTVFSDSYDFLDMSRSDSERIQISMIYTICIELVNDRSDRKYRHFHKAISRRMTNYRAILNRQKVT